MTAGPRTSIKGTARLAGGLYLSLVPLGFFSFVYARRFFLSAATPQLRLTISWHPSGCSGLAR
jgi:hypothetical protein